MDSIRDPKINEITLFFKLKELFDSRAEIRKNACFPVAKV